MPSPLDGLPDGSSKGGIIDDTVQRSALLDRYCAEIGRSPYPPNVAQWVTDTFITPLA